MSRCDRPRATGTLFVVLACLLTGVAALGVPASAGPASSLAGVDVPAPTIRVAAPGLAAGPPAAFDEFLTQAQCRSGIVVGGGIDQRLTAMPTGNGNHVNGSGPSLDGTAIVGPSGIAGADATRWLAIGGTGAVSSADFASAPYAMCLEHPDVAHSQVVVNSEPGIGTVVAACPKGTRLLGGGGRGTPASAGSFKPISTFPSFYDPAHDFGKRPASDGETNPDVWTTVGGNGGGTGDFKVYSFAVCTGAGVNSGGVAVKVRYREDAGPATQSTGQKATLGCESGDGRLIGGGAGVSGGGITAGDFTRPGSGGTHLNGSFPSDAAGVAVADGTTDAAYWTASSHTGGALSPATFTDVWALCATFPAAPTPGPTPTPSPAPDPGGRCGARGAYTSTPPTCTYTGTATTADPAAGTDLFTVPAGVSAVTADVYGGQGGAANGFIGTEPGGTGAPGGLGGHTRGTVTVTPGQVLQLTVGAAGTMPPSRRGAFAQAGGPGHGAGGPGGHGGGGSGGGASDVRVGAFADVDRILVAGGGGGAGNGGGPELAGGAGGGPAGAPGGSTGVATDAHAGGGASGTADGSGGGRSSSGAPGLPGGDIDVNSNARNPGSGGSGGTGGGGGYGGGGGGGGLHGGGGGGGGGSNVVKDGGGIGTDIAAGGGGGSGYSVPSVLDATLTAGVNAGAGKVVITWSEPNPTASPTPAPGPIASPLPLVSVLAGAAVPGPVPTMVEHATTTACSSGLLVGAGNAQAIGDETQMNSNGLRVNGIVPSVDGTEPQGAPGIVGRDVTRVISLGNTGGATQPGFSVRPLAVCLASAAVPHTQIVMNKLAGAAGRVTATCPTGARLLGGGGRVTPGTVGNMKVSAMYPTFDDDAHLHGARAAADGEANPDSWTAVGLINGSPTNSTYTTYAYAVCTGEGVDAAALTVTVRNHEELGPLPATTSLRMPISCRPGDGTLLSGGVSVGGTDTPSDLTVGSGLTNRSGYVIPSSGGGSDGDHLNGSYPGDGTGDIPPEGTSGPPTHWTGFTHSGGVASPNTFSNVWALCVSLGGATLPTPTPTPTPSPGPSVTPTPVVTPGPTAGPPWWCFVIQLWLPQPGSVELRFCPLVGKVTVRQIATVPHEHRAHVESAFESWRSR